MEQEINKLIKRSINNENFSNLFYLINKDENIAKAIKNYKTYGSKVSGINNKTIDDLYKLDSQQRIRYISKLFTKYNAGINKKVLKKNYDDFLREIMISNIEDRIIQLMIKQILEPIFETKFVNNSFGFRPNKSCYKAIYSIIKMINNSKFNYVIDIDIKKFYNNINPKTIIDRMKEIGIKDDRLLIIINKIMKAKATYKNKIINNKTGIPTGTILSPLLANIVLDKLDKYFIDKYPDEYLIRYADDIKIITNDLNKAKVIMNDIENYLNKELKLNINKEKSKIINIKYNYSTYLGFKIKLNNNKIKILIKDKKLNYLYNRINNQLEETEIKSILRYYNISKDTNNQINELLKAKGILFKIKFIDYKIYKNQTIINDDNIIKIKIDQIINNS